MHRSLLLGLALATALAAPVAAQEECTQAAPCEWALDVDADGFSQSEPFEGTQGDWVTLNLFNFDEVAHTVRFEGYGQQWTLEPMAEATSPPIELDEAGDFALADDPTGDRLTVSVLLTDPDDGTPIRDPDDVPEEGAGEDEEDTPGLALPVVVVALAALVLAARRRA